MMIVTFMIMYIAKGADYGYGEYDDKDDPTVSGNSIHTPCDQ